MSLADAESCQWASVRARQVLYAETGSWGTTHSGARTDRGVEFQPEEMLGSLLVGDGLMLDHLTGLPQGDLQASLEVLPVGKAHEEKVRLLQ